METATSILLAEEDAATRAFLAANLTADGCDIEGRRAGQLDHSLRAA